MVLLQAMFTLAIEWGEAHANPVSVVRKPRQGRRRAIEPLAPEHIERLRAVLLDYGDHRSATLVSVLAYAGLRPGEALGLEWRHVRDRTLLIEQAVSDGRLKRQKTNRVYRTVDLLEPLAEDLADWKAASRFIFPRPDGAPGASMTGTTGATATSTPRPTAPVSVVPGPTTFGTRSRRC